MWALNYRLHHKHISSDDRSINHAKPSDFQATYPKMTRHLSWGPHMAEVKNTWRLEVPVLTVLWG